MRPFIHPLLITCTLGGALHGQETPAPPPPVPLALKVEATFDKQKVTAPAALTFDQQGRVYISESPRLRNWLKEPPRTEWLLEDLASKDQQSRTSLLKKWNETFPKLDEPEDDVRLLADSDADGSLDQSTLFTDGRKLISRGIFHQSGWLYLGNNAGLSIFNTKEGIATIAPKIVDLGLGIRISLPGHEVHGFVLGPDGRIYGTTGDSGFVTATGNGRTHQESGGGAVFRFDLDGSGFEIIHTGLRNPGEIAFDQQGNGFVIDGAAAPGEKARLIYLMEGGNSGWKMEDQALLTSPETIGLEKNAPNRWQAEKMGQLANEDQPAYLLPPVALLDISPGGMTSHPVNGDLLAGDWQQENGKSGIWSFRMKPNGASMKLENLQKVVPDISPSDLEFSPAGRLFATDFPNDRLVSIGVGNEAWPDAGTNDAAALLKEGFSQRNSGELLVFLKHPDYRVRLQAQIALTRKPDAVAILTIASRSGELTGRLHGIWGLAMIARGVQPEMTQDGFANLPNNKFANLAIPPLLNLLKDPAPEIRAQVLRAMAAIPPMGDEIPFTSALVDPSPRVRFFALIAAGHHQAVGNYGPICDAISAEKDKDPALLIAGAYALQHLVQGPEMMANLYRNPSFRVRLAAVIGLRNLASPDLARYVKDESPAVADEAIRAITDLDITAALPAVAEQLDRASERKWSPFMLRRLLHNAYRLGTSENAIRLATFAGNPKQPEPLRLEAIRLLSLWAQPPAVDQLTGNWHPMEKRDAAEAIKALETILPRLAKAPETIRKAAGEILKTTPSN